jgi:hypothetical protein
MALIRQLAERTVRRTTDIAEIQFFRNSFLVT